MLLPQRSECSKRGFPHPLKVLRGVLEFPALLLGKTGQVCETNDSAGIDNEDYRIISGEEGVEKGRGNGDGISTSGDCCYSGLDVEELVVQSSLRALEKQTAMVRRALMITADTFAAVAGGGVKTVGVAGRIRKLSY